MFSSFIIFCEGVKLLLDLHLWFYSTNITKYEKVHSVNETKKDLMSSHLLQPVSIAHIINFKQINQVYFDEFSIKFMFLPKKETAHISICLI
jgi:hypothetical protein